MNNFKYIILESDSKYTSLERTEGISAELEKLWGDTSNVRTKLSISFIEDYSTPGIWALQGLLDYKILVNSGFNANNLLGYFGYKVTNEEKQILQAKLVKASKREAPYESGFIELQEMIPSTTTVYNYQYMLDNGWIDPNF